PPLPSRGPGASQGPSLFCSILSRQRDQLSPTFEQQLSVSRRSDLVGTERIAIVAFDQRSLARCQHAEIDSVSSWSLARTPIGGCGFRDTVSVEGNRWIAGIVINGHDILSNDIHSILRPPGYDLRAPDRLPVARRPEMVEV